MEGFLAVFFCWSVAAALVGVPSSMCLFSGLLPFVCWFDVCIGSLFLLFVVCPLLLCRPLCAVLSQGLRIQYRIEFGAPRPRHLSKILLLPGVVKYKELKRGKRERAPVSPTLGFFLTKQ